MGGKVRIRARAIQTTVQEIGNTVPLSELIKALAGAGVWAWCGHWRCGCKAAPQPNATTPYYNCMYHNKLAPNFVCFVPIDWELPEWRLEAIALSHGRNE